LLLIRVHSNMLLRCSRNIYYYQCWKHLLLYYFCQNCDSFFSVFCDQ